MDKKIYLHGISPSSNYNSSLTLYTLSRILQSRYLLSLRLQKKSSKNGFNGLDYISLCDYEKRFEINSNTENSILSSNIDGYNAFNYYIRYSLSLVFPKKELEVIIPKIIDSPITTKEGFINMKILGESTNERYSDMPDEVQVKDSISLDKMIGLTYPTHQLYTDHLSEEKNIKSIIKDLNKINQLLEKYGYNSKIFDIDTFEELSDYTSVKRLIHQRKKYY